MKFKKLVSVLCSATCGIGGVGAKQNGGMKEKIAQMKKESEEKGSKSLMTFNNFCNGCFFKFSKEDEEVLKARGVSGLLSGEVVNDVIEDLEALERDPEARKKVLELARSYEVKSRVKQFVSMFGGGIAVLGASGMLAGLMSILDLNFCDRSLENLEEIARYWRVPIDGIMTANVIRARIRRKFVIMTVVCLAIFSGLSPARFALYRSSLKGQGIKEALEKLVKEAEGMQDQVGASVNKLKEKKSGSSSSNGGSQKSGKGGSGKIKKRGRKT